VRVGDAESGLSENGGPKNVEPLQTNDSTGSTRKLSYRKDDRAMRPIYGCPENFRESLTTPKATFPEIFNELLFRLR